MKNIVLVPNESKDVGFVITESVVSKLLSLNFSICVSSVHGYAHKGVEICESFPKNTDLIVIVGGDGSVIDASKHAIKYGIPILGINLGKVGYLAEVETDNLDVLDKLVSGEYEIIEKMLLSVKLGDDSLDRYAVNDVVVSHDGHLGIADFKVEDSLGNVVKYRADGVILSTPQGSTAYSLSAGGPILAHDVESILLTPVSPHSFFNRSVLFNSSEHITVTNLGDGDLNISVDGRCLANLSKLGSCTVVKADKTIKMLTFSKNSMFSSLFRKMKNLGDMD
jgi:NAD+ kinase